MLMAHAGRYCDETLGLGKLAVGVVAGERYHEAKVRFGELMRRELPSTVPLSENYMRECLGMKEEIQEKMSALPPAEFEGVLHPVFEADELKLILVGAALGAAAGFAQSAAFI